MQISDAEWQVMKIVWMQENITSKETYQLINEKFDRIISTVKTLLKRLVSKKRLDTKKEGNKFYYFPLIPEEDSIHQLTKEVTEMSCLMNIKNIVSELIMSNEFTHQDLDRLEQSDTR
ncbi:BlaI/MecI/CopY family transcriptional regulator [Pisciglobus halotolerans]|uniref:Copper transport repressor, CopY/TcrY family n=1 Tax=Pisciglobus halotolerans TaxID=745365 RepID=A0A1I3B1W5_9LACT|nr:BlaI/MecI/CopY family transcriptional regulator [Pisciglobus halotolerans]SFH56307.1 copper transport repressor, CopY/TcrY family [Pisciglobus halotolerans]